MPIVKVFGDGFTIKLTDGIGQDAGVLKIGDNVVDEGTYGAEIILGKGYTFINGYIVDGIGNQENIENTIFTLTVGIYGGEEIYVTTQYDEVKPPTPTPKVSGFNHLYFVDKNILKSLASERFATGGTSKVDLGTFIINVLELPFKLDDSLKGVENQIVLGYTVASTKAVELLKDELVIDFGKIHIPNKYNNSFDYLNTETRLHAPFSNIINLDANYVVGYDINVKYIIDLYTGDGTINVTSSKIKKVIHSETVKIGRNIPFIRYNNDVVNSISSNYGVNNELLSPYIEVIRNIPYYDNVFTNEVVTYGQLNNVKGYVTVNNIILNSSATQQEKNEIVNLLRNGVYIK